MCKGHYTAVQSHVKKLTKACTSKLDNKYSALNESIRQKKGKIESSDCNLSSKKVGTLCKTSGKTECNDLQIFFVYIVYVYILNKDKIFNVKTDEFYCFF